MPKLLIYLILVYLVSSSLADTKRIAITIDDLPTLSHGIIDSTSQQEYFRDVLNILNENNIEATGFVVGNLINDGNENLLAEFLEDGHKIGNHTFSHPDLHRISAGDFIDDIEYNKELIKKYNDQINYFRYPMLHRGQHQAKKDSVYHYLEKKELKVAPVTIDTDEADYNIRFVKAWFKGNFKEAELIGQEYVEHMVEKSLHYDSLGCSMFGRPVRHILLTHMNFINSHYLDDLINWYQGNEWEFITLDEAMNDPVFLSDDIYLGRKGVSWFERLSTVDSIPEIKIDRLTYVPDVMQTDQMNDFPDNGKYYCAPVSAANYLVWLGKSEFSNIIDTTLTNKENVLNISNTLGNMDYMNIDKYGIPPNKFLNSLVNYIQEFGYTIKNINYWGFDHYTSDITPTLDHLKETLSGNSMSWLLVGKYRYEPDTDTYVSRAFHYISLVGYGIDENNTPDPQSLIVHCSSPRSGKEPMAEYLTTSILHTGTIDIQQLSIKKKASGFIRLDGLKWQKPNDIIIVSGFVSLEIE